MKDPKEIRELLSAHIALHDLLAEAGIKLPQVIRAQQLSCPFHGRDLSQSARYYPETNSMYCWVCRKSWDPISFWAQYNSAKWMSAAESLASKYKVDLTKLTDLKVVSFTKYRGGKALNAMDRRKMALFVLEEQLKVVLPIEEPKIAAKMLYVLASARHIQDDTEFAKVTLPLARRINEALTV